MRFANELRLPDTPPQVPFSLTKRVRPNIAGLIRIVLQVDDGGSWRKFNELQFDTEPEAADVPVIEELLVACANEHAGGQPGRRYRALLWRKVGVEKERRVATFWTASTPTVRRRRPLRGRVREAHKQRQRRWQHQVERMRRDQEEVRRAAERREQERHAKLVEHSRHLLDELMLSYGEALKAKDHIGLIVACAQFAAKCQEIDNTPMPPLLRRNVVMAAKDRIVWTTRLLAA